MSKTPFQKFIELVAFDQSTRAFQKECEHLQQQLVSEQDRKKELFNHQESLKQNVYQARKAVDAYELEMKSLDEQEKQKKQRFNTSNNLKEYNSLSAELDVVHKEQQAKEEQVITAWQKLELAQQGLALFEKSYNEKIDECEKQIQLYTKKHADCIDQLAHREKERTHGEQGIPEEWLEKYNAMRLHIADPVVPLDDDVCSVCFQNIPKYEIVQILRGALVPCKGCYRLLYAPDNIKGNHEK